MKYVATFSTFDSALVVQGDLLSLTEDGCLVHGYAGLDWHRADNSEILNISKNLAVLAHNDDGTFWAEVTLDSETGEVVKSGGLYRVDHSQSVDGGYGDAIEIKIV